jgi:hypothetical protein
MMIRVQSNLSQLLSGCFPEATVTELLQTVSLNPAIAEEFGSNCSRAVIAQALNLGLLADLLARVPSARTYLDGLKEQSRRLVFDHGALRTVGLAGMGSLPAGEQAIARVLRPLGYVRAEHYPLDRLKMTGWSYRHRDFPEDLPQFFVSELHVERFSPEFQEAAARVTASSDDPLTDAHREVLDTLDRDHHLKLDDAIQLLGTLIACFTRRHQPPALADYELLLAESAEMAWIATEGNAFNHATDRVSDVEALAQAERDLGRRMKDAVEVSSSRRVRQTAYRADPILRPFIDGTGEETLREVPGSFFEFIQRDMMPDASRLDLSFDTGNAQGIFKMTAAQTA